MGKGVQGFNAHNAAFSARPHIMRIMRNIGKNTEFSIFYLNNKKTSARVCVHNARIAYVRETILFSMQTAEKEKLLQNVHLHI